MEDGRRAAEVVQRTIDLSELADTFSSLSEFQSHCDANSKLMVSRFQVENQLRMLTRTPGHWPGWSELAGGATSFWFDCLDEGRPADLREQMICAKTGLSARLRFGFHLAEHLIDDPERARVYMTEQATGAYAWARKRYPRLVGSEYFSEEQRDHLTERIEALGIENENPRFEDATALSFEDQSMDAVISFDVLEHVPRYRAVLDEFARVLRLGGHLILTAPFMQDREETRIRASVGEDGEITHHLEPEYHGDPVRSEGALCFQHFGWDLLEATRQAGFREVVYAQPWDLSRGLIGPLWALVARK